MTWYEELGLTPAARDEDIRKAHRTLSKLLHPDHQTDAAVRGAADIQMRRLNVIVDTLLDPERRRDYDESLSQRQKPEVVVKRMPFQRPAASLLVTILGALALTVAAVWFYAGDLMRFQPSTAAATDPPPPQGRDTPPTPASASKSPETHEPSGPSRPATLSIDPSRVQRAPLPVEMPAAAPAVPEPAPVPTPPPAASVTAAPQQPAPQLVEFSPPPITPNPVSSPPPAAPSFDGLWVYSPAAPKTEQSRIPLYAPEYIELHLRSLDNTISGKYAARYRVQDRAISPHVDFNFEGRQGGKNEFEWRADDGTQGVIGLEILTPHSMQVDWRVAQFGSRIGLGAGTAVLIRKAAK
jgi:DnaJ domain